MSLLTEAQLIEACQGFAHGSSSKYFIDKFYQELHDNDTLPTDKSEAEIRKLLSNELATTKPSSPRFLRTKFGEIVELERHLMEQEWAARYHENVDALLNECREQLEGVNQRIKLLQEAVDGYFTDAEAQTIPKTPQEFSAASTALLRLQKEQRELRMLIVKVSENLANPIDVREIK